MYCEATLESYLRTIIVGTPTFNSKNFVFIYLFTFQSLFESFIHVLMVSTPTPSPSGSSHFSTSFPPPPSPTISHILFKATESTQCLQCIHSAIHRSVSSLLEIAPLKHTDACPQEPSISSSSLARGGSSAGLFSCRSGGYSHCLLHCLENTNCSPPSPHC